MTEPIANAAAARIEGSPSVLSCQRMPSGFANSNYRLETAAGTYLLRNCSGRDRAEVDYELDVLDWLSSHDFPSPAALRFEGGDRWIVGPGETYCVLLEWMEGSEPSPNLSNTKSVAHALGELHQLPAPSGEWWRRRNPNGFEAAERLAESITPDDPALFQFFAREFEYLRNRLGEELPTGLIHGDLFTDNTLFQGDQLVALIDFEDACEDALLFDVAMTIHGFCFPEEKWRANLAETFLGAYTERRVLNTLELELLPEYLCWCSLSMMGWHLRQLQIRPNRGNERRAGELARRTTTMREANWSPF